MGLVKGCIFDLDGVIVDTAHYHYLAWKRLAREFGYDLSEAENEELKGVSRMQSLEIVLDLIGVSMDKEQKETLANRKNLWFNEYVGGMQPTEVFPGVKGLISSLRSEGIKVGLASSSKNAPTVIRLLGIANEFDTIVDGTMISKTKPDPEIFLTTAKRLFLQPANCVVIEDAAAGVEAALSAGMKCIGIGSPDLLFKADKVFARTGDIKLATLRELEAVSR